MDNANDLWINNMRVYRISRKYDDNLDPSMILDNNVVPYLKSGRPFIYWDDPIHDYYMFCIEKI